MSVKRYKVNDVDAIFVDNTPDFGIGAFVVWESGESWDDVQVKIAAVGGTAMILVPFDDWDRIITGTDVDVNGLYFFGLQGLTLFHTRLNCTITIDPTATLITDFRLRSFNIIWQSSAHVGAGAPFYMELSNGAWIHSHATDAAFECSTSGANPPCTVVLYGDAAITAAGAAPVFHAPANVGGVEIAGFDSTTLNANSVVGDAASTVGVEVAATCQVDRTTVFSGAGTFFFIVLDEQYVAAVAADWNNNPPTTVKAALDRIAAKITPIP